MSYVVLAVYALIGVLIANAAFGKRQEVSPVILAAVYATFVLIWPFVLSITIHRVLRSRRRSS